QGHLGPHDAVRVDLVVDYPGERLRHGGLGDDSHVQAEVRGLGFGDLEADLPVAAHVDVEPAGRVEGDRGVAGRAVDDRGRGVDEVVELGGGQLGVDGGRRGEDQGSHGDGGAHDGPPRLAGE